MLDYDDEGSLLVEWDINEEQTGQNCSFVTTAEVTNEMPL